MKIDAQEALCVIYRRTWVVSLTCCLPCGLLLLADVRTVENWASLG